MRKFLCLLVVGLGAGCAALPPFDPVDNEQRTVTPVSDHARVLTLKEPEVWYDGQPPRNGIRLPAGDYVIEAEDDAFWYFAAPAQIELRGLNAGTFAGGIALRKHFVPGGA